MKHLKWNLQKKSAMWNDVRFFKWCIFFCISFVKIPIRQWSQRFCIFSFSFRVVDSLSGPLTIHCDLINSIKYVVFIDYKHLLCTVENMNGFTSSPSTYLNVLSFLCGRWCVYVCVECAIACGKCVTTIPHPISLVPANRTQRIIIIKNGKTRNVSHWI